MKTPTKTPRTPRKTTSTAAKATPAVKKLTAPRIRRVPKKAVAPDSPDAPRRMPSTDDVRFRAYEIYLGRTSDGDAVSDWLQAERELMSLA